MFMAEKWHFRTDLILLYFIVTSMRHTEGLSISQ